MKYAEGNITRVFVLKFDDGDDFRSEMIRFCKEKNIRTGHVQLLGAVRKTKVVVGPKKTVVPPEPLWKSLTEGHEVMGYGTIFWKDDEPMVHVHSIFSRKDKSFIGCVRTETNVFLVIEAIITEFGFDKKVIKKRDKNTGLDLLTIEEN